MGGAFGIGKFKLNFILVKFHSIFRDVAGPGTGALKIIQWKI